MRMSRNMSAKVKGVDQCLPVAAWINEVRASMPGELTLLCQTEAKTIRKKLEPVGRDPVMLLDFNQRLLVHSVFLKFFLLRQEILEDYDIPHHLREVFFKMGERKGGFQRQLKILPFGCVQLSMFESSVIEVLMSVTQSGLAFYSSEMHICYLGLPAHYDT